MRRQEDLPPGQKAIRPRRAGLRPDERDPADKPGPPGSAGGGVNMSGAPGGGGANGGMAGSNVGDGAPGNAKHLEDALGSGLFDNAGDKVESRPPYAGPSGGAVGGTPAEKRAKGGRIHRGLAPDTD